MSIELPPIPETPNADSSPEQWARYLDIARLHVSQESVSAIKAQTEQMVLMTTATNAHVSIGQQMLDNMPSGGGGVSEETLLEAMRISRGVVPGG